MGRSQPARSRHQGSDKMVVGWARGGGQRSASPTSSIHSSQVPTSAGAFNRAMQATAARQAGTRDAQLALDKSPRGSSKSPPGALPLPLIPPGHSSDPDDTVIRAAAAANPRTPARLLRAPAVAPSHRLMLRGNGRAGSPHSGSTGKPGSSPGNSSRRKKAALDMSPRAVRNRWKEDQKKIKVCVGRRAFECAGRALVSCRALPWSTARRGAPPPSSYPPSTRWGITRSNAGTSRWPKQQGRQPQSRASMLTTCQHAQAARTSPIRADLVAVCTLPWLVSA